MSFGIRAPFKWRNKSCPDGDAGSCWLDHGDLSVTDGQCQDEFLRCTEPGLEQKRINVTSRWIWQRVASRPAERTGVAFSLPACSQDSSAAVREFVGVCVFQILSALRGPVHVGWRGGGEALALLVYALASTGSGLRSCGYRRTRPVAGGRREHHLRGLLRVRNCALTAGKGSFNYHDAMLYMLASVTLLQGFFACMVF